MDAEALADTNIFLEIILRQERYALCESLLRQRDHQIAMSDFSLSSIGIYLFRSNRENAFLNFIRDIDGVLSILDLELKDYSKIYDNSKKFGLDYDDSYQLAIAEVYGLELITLDKDFQDLDSPVPITVIR